MDFKFNKKTHEKVFKFYNLKHDEIYNHYEQKRLFSEIKKIVNNMDKKKIKVLDFGAGTGNLSLKFLELGCEVVAVDVSLNSLKLLKKLSENSPKLTIKVLDCKNLPFNNNEFDIVATYSVLHHIPDYLYAYQEMIRVCKKKGYIFVDHEFNENKWNPNKCLEQYYNKAKLTKLEFIKKKIKTLEFFTFPFWRSIIIKTFINNKYQREGDIHVWKNDHIEWDKIKSLVKYLNCKIYEENNYLLYYPKINYKEYSIYKKKCNDTKCLIVKK